MLTDKDLEDLILFVLDALYRDSFSDADTPTMLAYFRRIGIRPLPDKKRVTKVLTRILEEG